MQRSTRRVWSAMTLLACSVAPLASTGCQTTVGGQTLPSAYYLRDDVQYFPTGPEFKLTNEARALEEYRLQQLAPEGTQPPPP